MALGTVHLVAALVVGQAILGGARLAGPPRDEAITLTWEKIAQLARSESPDILLARAQATEASAHLVGASMYSTTNPSLSSLGGHYFPRDHAKPKYSEYYIRLTWPLPVSGDFSQRSALAERGVESAELTVRNALRTAVTEALSLVLEAQAARDLRAVAARRARWDEDILRVAQVRRKAEGGDKRQADVALAHLLRAQQQAVLRRAEAEEEAALARLRRSLGFDQSANLELPQELPPLDSPASREVLLERLGRRPDLRRALTQVEAARTRQNLERRLALPVPNLLLQGGQVPDAFGSLGVDVQLPIFQRNQTQRAVAEAAVALRKTEARLLFSEAERDLYIAYARWDGDSAALDSLVENERIMGESELITQRAYAEGQNNLSQLVVARREGNLARTAVVELRREVGLARLRLVLAAGEALPFSSPQQTQPALR